MQDQAQLKLDLSLSTGMVTGHLERLPETLFADPVVKQSLQDFLRLETAIVDDICASEVASGPAGTDFQQLSDQASNIRIDLSSTEEEKPAVSVDEALDGIRVRRQRLFEWMETQPSGGICAGIRFGDGRQLHTTQAVYWLIYLTDELAHGLLRRASVPAHTQG